VCGFCFHKAARSFSRLEIVNLVENLVFGYIC
jgi:hypothetical protein